ncbi:MAG: hypothetical protein U1C46_01430 [Bacteroidales bacterium]|nr:hypothetical protein [Bacteroidales bacterium]
MNKELIQELVKLIAPGIINENFELQGIDEKTDTITIVFEEKQELIPQELKGKEVVLDGFLNPVELQTFPLKDKAVYLSIKRRRWKEKGSQGPTYNNTYNLHRKGMKTTNEFGLFLKEELGLRPSEYNKLWGSLTH